MCAANLKRKKVATPWKDFTLEVWVQRMNLKLNGCETIASYNSETFPQVTFACPCNVTQFICTMRLVCRETIFFVTPQQQSVS